jgi:hypothetical protein
MESIFTLAGKFDSTVALQNHCNSQHRALEEAKVRLVQLGDENVYLREQIEKLQNSDSTVVINKSSEQLICEMEIDRLKKTSLERGLTLEETKRLDLVVKNLLLAKGVHKVIEPDYKRLPEGITQDNLLTLASLPDLSITNNG